MSTITSLPKELNMNDFAEFVKAMSLIDPKFKQGVNMIIAGKDSSDVICEIHSDQELAILARNGEFIDERVDDLSAKMKGKVLGDLVEKDFIDPSLRSSTAIDSTKEDLVLVPETTVISEVTDAEKITVVDASSSLPSDSIATDSIVASV